MRYSDGIELNLPVNENFCSSYYRQAIKNNPLVCNLRWNDYAQLHRLLTGQAWKIVRMSCSEWDDVQAVSIMRSLMRVFLAGYLHPCPQDKEMPLRFQ